VNKITKKSIEMKKLIEMKKDNTKLTTKKTQKNI